MNTILIYLLITYSVVSLLYLVILLIKFGKRSLNYWKTFNLFVLIMVPGAILFPLSYIFRKHVTKYQNFHKWTTLYWYADLTEPTFNDCWYGVYEMFDEYEPYSSKLYQFNKLNWIQKFILSYRWSVLRNGQWNFREKICEHLRSGINESSIEIIEFEGTGKPIDFRNQWLEGVSHVNFNLNNGTKQFRYSFTIELSENNIFRIFGFKYWNVMLGAGPKRYITKSRFFKFLK